ncbi:hypothetical protein [Bradyrhizobium sp. Arg816]|uniref:hypothetical protein n=1 Tax=Bradyrhizobium sp. Arg816 TaxID=2998491 RepID=UPI00249E878C|nr:hypothetical protein [Bradyrhizobium sp. Arg816]MDI3564002.1 hypothetical protein [Bradyrhizobium sp. Arg816]
MLYLLSIVAVGVGLYLRFAMPETPEFARDVRDRRAEISVPLWEAFDGETVQFYA